ncbi:MAG: hypothetical protein WAU96_02455, partial [Anaerolineae bacterium]
DPPILVADEPTGNLDSRTAEAVFTLFTKLVQNGKTILMVTHDKELATRTTRAVIVADGEIIQDGRRETEDRLGQNSVSRPPSSVLSNQT